jgi:hypothetical protein
VTQVAHGMSTAVIQADAPSVCLDCNHAMGEHILIRTGDNNLIICQATECDCVEIRSSASIAGCHGSTEPGVNDHPK